jgi:hypothetical protein
MGISLAGRMEGKKKISFEKSVMIKFNAPSLVDNFM